MKAANRAVSDEGCKSCRFRKKPKIDEGQGNPKINEELDHDDSLIGEPPSDSGDDICAEKCEDKRKLCELSDEELLDFFEDHPECPLNKERVIEKTLPTLRKYLKQLDDSDGFDIDVFPGWIMALSPIAPSRFCTGFVESDEVYENLAKVAIDEYNKEEETEYGDVQFEKVNLSISNYFHYYLTFTAMDYNAGGSGQTGARETFQAKVSLRKIGKDNEPDVKFCRLKRKTGAL